MLGGSPVAMTLGWSLYLSSDCLEDDAVDSSGERFDDVDDDRSDEDRSDACVTGVIFPLFALCINVEMILTKSF